jgi:hypothetical protein
MITCGALEEMLFSGKTLNLKLLGGSATELGATQGQSLPLFLTRSKQ